MLRGHEGVSVPFQLIFTFAGLIVLGIYRIKILPENKRAHFNFETVKFVLLRCSTNIFGLILVNLTCRYLDVDTATAIIFMSPLFSSLLSVTFFETKFTSEDVKVFAICLIGVVFACQPFNPSPNNTALGFIYALIALGVVSFSPIFSKLMYKFADPAYFFFVSGIIGFVFFTGVAMKNGINSTISFYNITFLVAGSSINCIGMVLYEWSLSKVDVRLILPFNYLSVLFAFILNLVFFSGDFSIGKFIGVVLIVGVNMKDVIIELLK